MTITGPTNTALSGAAAAPERAQQCHRQHQARRRPAGQAVQPGDLPAQSREHLAIRERVEADPFLSAKDSGLSGIRAVRLFAAPAERNPEAYASERPVRSTAQPAGD